MLIRSFKIGFPTFVSQLLMSVSVSFVNKQAGIYGGDNAIAAIGIVTKLVFIVMYLVFGLGMGFQPIAGYSFGANKIKRLFDSLKFYFTFCLLHFWILFCNDFYFWRILT